MKFFIALFIVCGSLPINAMSDDKRIGGGISGANKKVQLCEEYDLLLPHGSALYRKIHEKNKFDTSKNESEIKKVQYSKDFLPVV